LALLPYSIILEAQGREKNKGPLGERVGAEDPSLS